MSKEISEEKTNSLLNCPFCGGEAKIDKTITNTVSVECTVCHASSRMILCTEGDIEQKAIEAWNTRKPMQNIVERLEEELHLSDKEKRRCIHENPLQFDEAKGHARGIANAIEILKEEGGLHEI